MTVVLIVGLALLLILGVSGVALDTRNGTPASQAWRRPDLALRRVTSDFFAGRSALPHSDWATQVGATFAEPRHLRRRTDRIETAKVAVADLKARLAAIALESAGGEGPAAEIERDLVERREEAIGLISAVLEERDAASARLTIVLFGRTKVGKSSLFAALTGTGFDGIGDGRQNFTKELRTDVIRDVEVIDSPGIDGVGSAPLEVATERAVHAADVLVVQISDVAVYLEDFQRLAALGDHKRPVVIAVNVKKGDTKLLIAHPERVFRAPRLEPHIERLRGGLPANWAHSPIVAYHARGAVAARRARRSVALALWEASRITDVIGAIAAEEESAVEYGAHASDDALRHVLAELVADEGRASADVKLLVDRSQNALAEIKAILMEVSRSRGAVHRQIDDHFVVAEEGLLEAITDATDEYSEAVSSAVAGEQLLTLLQEQLEAAAQELGEKYEEFRTDVQLAARISLDAKHLDAMHLEYQEQIRRRDEHKSRVKRRRIMRIGSSVGFAFATIAASEVPPLMPIIAAAGVGVDRALRDPKGPEPDDPEARQRRVRQLLADAAKQARADFDKALDDQVLAPAHDRLVDPARLKLEELRDLDERIGEALAVERRTLAEAERRLMQETEQEKVVAID